MEGNLKVTPERLHSAAGEFGEVGGKIKNLTGQMLDGIHKMKGVWEGEAADVYHRKFSSLQGDMDKMYRIIQEHVSDLQEMARLYQEAERINAEESNALIHDVIV